LDNLVTFLAAIQERNAQPETVTVSGVDHPAYRAIPRLHVTPTAPAPRSPRPHRKTPTP
jgi:hypothetical protein